MATSAKVSNQGASIVRWVLYSHLVAVGVCVSFSLADGGILVNSHFSKLFYNHFGILLLPALLAWVLCPAVLVFSLARGFVSERSGFRSLFAEILLCVVQMFALLPAYS